MQRSPVSFSTARTLTPTVFLTLDRRRFHVTLFTTPDWREIAADDLLIFELKEGKKVIMQLAPEFAPVHVANIRALAKAGWWDGAAIYRVQDNYVAQWGINEAKRAWRAGEFALPPGDNAVAREI